MAMKALKREKLRYKKALEKQQDIEVRSEKVAKRKQSTGKRRMPALRQKHRRKNTPTRFRL